MPRRPSRAPGLVALVLALGCSLALSAQAVTPPLAPVQQFQVRGSGFATVNGPHCCGDTRFTGRFEAAYEIDGAGQARLAALRIALDDTDVVVEDGFLGLFSTRVQVRCGNAASAAPASGFLTDPSHIKFGPGALGLAGQASEERLADGSCADPTLAWNGTNDVETLLLHDPAAGSFGLDGSFHTVVEGEPSTLTLHLEGGFVNRPPQAAFALRRAGEPYPQSGCPAVWRWNGQLWELVAEANAPDGLKGDAHSFSTDPDGGWPQGDVFTEDWFLTSGSGPRDFVTAGRDTGPLLFGWGPTHRLELLAGDHVGATSAASCSFRVIDTRPPVVAPPGAVVLGCSTVGGATPATSPALRAFLGGATASDASDPAPVQLNPRLGSSDVTETTLFPADGAARPVTFRFQDRWGNLGQASSSVNVNDTVPPVASARPAPAALAADLKYWWIRDDPDGQRRLRPARDLAPALDRLERPCLRRRRHPGASLRQRRPRLLSVLTPAGAGLRRVYTITYEAKDAAGNAALVEASVTVG